MSTKDVNAKAVALEKKLNGKLFIGGTQPSADDVKAFNDLLGSGNINVYRWVKHIATFTEAERKAWGAPVKVVLPKGPEDAFPAMMVAPKPAAAAATSAAAPAPAKPAAAAAAAVPAPAKPAPAAAAAVDDDDIDLFGDATEEETAALEAKKVKDAEKKKEKKAVIAKSSILFDVKAWDDTVDLEALAQKLNAIKKDGLLWGEHKLVPVAFGVKKLQQLIVIEDDKISGDDLEDMIMGFEDEVQSMDIVAWNKI